MKQLPVCMFIVLLALMGLLDSCISLEDRIMSAEERYETRIIGSVSTTWTVTNGLHIVNQAALKRKAYTELMAIAQRRYPGAIEIQNIIITGSFSWWNVLWAYCWFISPIFLDVQKIHAQGDVVEHTLGPKKDTSRLEAAIQQACKAVIPKLPPQVPVAVLRVSADTQETASFVREEVEYQLVDSGLFTILDRHTADAIRAEQEFQLSGEVSDDSAVSIGSLLGAHIVITGSVSEEIGARRVTLKALDVQTGRIVTMSRAAW
ncbi:MAG: penicillin-binding protein activator LpoB [Spirochaetaceae bacterium]|nr:penicillin-binding protein activator LpoB [Spirochaetaceae bacterium]